MDSIYRRFDLEFAFSNVFLMDRLKELQTDEYTEESDPESWNSGQISRKNRNEEIQRILNLMRNKDWLRDEASVKFDLISNKMSYEIDDEERSTLFSSNRNGTGHHNPRVTLADQFTWGAVVCAGVFIVVFVCVMAAWWVHKKQQDCARDRLAQAEARRQASLAPFCIENAVRRLSSSRLSTTTDLDIQRPPSYFEVIGFFDPPPSYNDVQSLGDHINTTQGYENAAVTIDELPPPFTEEESKSDKVNNTSSETSTVDNTPTVIVIPTTNEGPNCSSA